MSKLSPCNSGVFCFSLFLGLQTASLGVFAESKIETTTQPFTVKIGVSRVIYNPEGNGETLSVSNPQDYPALIQTSVLGDDKKSKAPFVVMPPLFRLDGQQQAHLRIVRTGGDFAKDRESLQWLCVRAIPPEASDEWGRGKNGKPAASDKVSMNLRISVSTCIKLIIRPESVEGAQGDSDRQALTWQYQGGKLKVTNSSPRYMSLSSLKVGGKDIQDINYIPPLSSYDITLPNKNMGNKVQWTIMDDYGGKSPVYEADIK
ncbi:MAG: fimbria/pilus periplasmic chaperone [Hafnia sp.]